ncbi:hypothetical protein Droror1_Dr00025731 [Drosera rotundifolia]
MSTPSSMQQSLQRLFTPETLRTAAKQTLGCHVIPVRLRRAIKTYLKEQEIVNMKRKVLRLTESFRVVKEANRLLASSTGKELVEDPMREGTGRRWKVGGVGVGGGDVGVLYGEDEVGAYVATRMPAVYAACYRVLREVKKRVPGFSPASVVDFGSGTGSGFWALRELWPNCIEKINLVEPSHSMQRAGQNLVQDAKKLPLIRSYGSIQSLSRDISKSERRHDLVLASYVLGEIPSLKDRITIVRQLWDLTGDILVLVEPGTPEGSNIISQMRSHILWMEKRKCRKQDKSSDGASQGADAPKNGAFVLAPCPHDGPCPLQKSGKYCHFVQRLQRTSSQRIYKRSKGGALRGYEDEKFSYVVLKRGKRPQESWPLDGIKFETLKELHAKRDPAELEIDYEDQFTTESEEDDELSQEEDRSMYDSDIPEPDATTESEDVVDEEEDEVQAGLGSGWGRIVFPVQKAGKRIEFDVCRSSKRDGSEGSFNHIVVTQAKNPALHRQARKSRWGDLWPF